MSDYNIGPKPKVRAGLLYSPVKDVVSSYNATFGWSSAEHAALVRINYVTKIYLNDNLFVETETSFRSVSVNLREN